MAQIIRPASVRIVPRDGELEITLNINITIDGTVTATAERAQSVTVQQTIAAEAVEDKVQHIIPDFISGMKLSSFGKKEQI